jgi:hypothetical protein
MANRAFEKCGTEHDMQDFKISVEDTRSKRDAQLQARFLGVKNSFSAMECAFWWVKSAGRGMG